MKKTLLLLAVTFSIAHLSLAQLHDHTHGDMPAQFGTHPETNFSCGWGGEDIINMKSFRSNAEAEAVMSDILSVLGLRPNYKIQAAKVPNAAAVVYGDQRFIYYNPKFMQNVTDATNTNWGSISIVAHELGHHLNGHTLKAGGSQRPMELEADEFSGFVLRKMGATLDESQAAMRRLAGKGSATHPGKTERLLAIEKGWRSADRQITGYSRTTTVPTARNRSTTQTNPRNTAEEAATQEETIASTSTRTNTSPRNTTTATAGAPPAFAAFRVTLRSNPEKEYYITTRYKFVAIRDGKVNILGELTSTENERYPYKIDFENEQIGDLMISRKGELMSMKGSIVGSLARVQRQQQHSFMGIDVY
ncbi:MAG: hypothetical protein AAF806_02615 [Bacteroidota bacterium]